MGKVRFLDNVRAAAAAKGIRSIAITDHGPGHLTYGIKMEQLPQMRKRYRRAKAEFPEMEILLGVEANTMRVAPYLDVAPVQRPQFDILLAGYHYGITHAGMAANYLYRHTGLFHSENSSLLVKKNTAMILDCLYANEEAGNHIDILTHPGDKGPFDGGHCQSLRRYGYAG